MGICLTSSGGPSLKPTDSKKCFYVCQYKHFLIDLVRRYVLKTFGYLTFRATTSDSQLKYNNEFISEKKVT